MPTSARKTPAKPTAKPAAKPEPSNEYSDRIDGMLSGNLTSEPELRFTASGRSVTNLRVACNERVKNDETGVWEDTEPEFYTITVWGQQGENLCESLSKGDRIVAIGYFQYRTWTNNDGDPVTTTEFTAREIGPSLLFRQVTVKRIARSK